MSFAKSFCISYVRGNSRIGAGLAVVVAQTLVSAEEPQPIANGRTAETAREVLVLRASVTALLSLGAEIRERNRLAGESRRLSEVRRVEEKPLAALFGDDVDHPALHVAELRGRPDGVDLHFLDEIDARLGSRDAAAWAGGVQAIDEKQVLVRARAEHGDGRSDTA